jgi:hypothetical protein
VTYLVLEYSHDIFFCLGNYSCSIRNTVLFYTCFFAPESTLPPHLCLMRLLLPDLPKRQWWIQPYDLQFGSWRRWLSGSGVGSVFSFHLLVLTVSGCEVRFEVSPSVFSGWFLVPTATGAQELSCHKDFFHIQRWSAARDRWGRLLPLNNQHSTESAWRGTQLVAGESMSGACARSWSPSRPLWCCHKSQRGGPTCLLLICWRSPPCCHSRSPNTWAQILQWSASSKLAGRRYMSGRSAHLLPKRGELRWVGPLFHPLPLVPVLGRLVIDKMSVPRLLEEQCWSKLLLKRWGPSGLKCLLPSECRLLESLLGETFWWRGSFDNLACPLLMVELDVGSSSRRPRRLSTSCCCWEDRSALLLWWRWDDFRSGGQRKR